MKEIRAAVNGFLNGEPLKLPKVKASELFKNSACQLTVKMIPHWYNSNKNNLNWDITDLKALQKDYKKIGALDKSEMLNSLIKIVQTANKS
jgi:hypothetical protein